MAVLADPSGAAFGLWQAGTMIGAGLVNEPGGLVWEDLRSTDPEAAGVLRRPVRLRRTSRSRWPGPTTRPSGCPTSRTSLGGMGGLMGLPDGTPSHWLVYFQVADADAAVAAAERAGGTVVAPADGHPVRPHGVPRRPRRRHLHGHGDDPAQPRSRPQRLTAA